MYEFFLIFSVYKPNIFDSFLGTLWKTLLNRSQIPKNDTSKYLTQREIAKIRQMPAALFGTTNIVHQSAGM